MPLINTMGMKVGSENAFGAGYHVLPIWKKRLSAKTLVTTPNSDVIYAMSYVDLGSGPLVFEASPNLQGILLDFWQRPIQGPIVRGQNFMKGKPFRPDAKTRRILDAAAASAYQMSRVLGTKSEVDGVSYKVGHSRSTTQNTHPASTTGSRSRHSARATSLQSTPTASIDLYFGAKAPAGREKNWLALVPSRGFFAIIRLYSPTEGAFDGSWKPSDFEEIK